MKISVAMMLGGLALIVGCAREPQPRTVADFLENPIMLEAAVVRCAQNRAESRYDAECISARQAVSLIEAKEERIRHEAFEAQSEKKREALRRTQLAAAKARRRAAEARRMRKEADYLAQFGEAPPSGDGEASFGEPVTNAPGMVISEPTDDSSAAPPPRNPPPATDSGTAPVVEDAQAPRVVEDAQAPSDLGAIRDELRKRNEVSAD